MLNSLSKSILSYFDCQNCLSTVNTESNQQVLAEANTQVNTEISDRIGANLKQELFGDRKSKESSIRFTVDIPESLNKRLAQLSLDTGKPKTELVRTILNQALSSLDY